MGSKTSIGLVALFVASATAALAAPVTKPDIAHTDKGHMSIQGPAYVGTTPGRPFLFLVPATGKSFRYSVDNLPEGLTLDSKSGIITGSVKTAGKTTAMLRLSGGNRWVKRTLTIVAGEHKLAQTPPMGWNSWNVWGCSVDDAKVRDAADWMVKSGLAAHGYQYINIDDCWEGERDSAGNITTNKKFPDMKALADYVHSKGLKLGIYSSPGSKTCAGQEGSYQHEAQDAKTYAQWGIDYIKYDWCSYGSIAKDRSLPELQKPYNVMRKALDDCSRDIVYSLCQYGMGDVWDWGKDVGANLWRTTGDIGDSWSSLSDIGFKQADLSKYAGPGHWNDPDMMVVGMVGWGPNVRPSNLTPIEQQTHVTLWCMLAAPLLLGCDLSKLDDWTTDLLTNDEVIAVNQDPQGLQGNRVSKTGDTEVWMKDYWDGTIAVALFNRGGEEAEVTATWTDLGLKGKQKIRDLWLKKDIGSFDEKYSAKIPAHGSKLIMIKEK